MTKNRPWLLLLVFGCGSTEPAQDSHVPQVGRYDYRLTHNGQTLSADLVIEAASASQVRYRFYFPSPSSEGAKTASPVGDGWPLLVFDLGGRSATNIMTRTGTSYGCTANVLYQTTFSPGTCTFTFEGPDSVRVAP